MPIDRARYPENWDQISLSIRERAGNHCEKCGAPNGQYVYRRGVVGEWLTMLEWHCLQYPLKNEFWPVKIVLTVHHVGIAKPDGTPGDRHDKMDCRPENLQALCQSCHWKADWDIHFMRRNSAAEARQIEAGQLRLL